MPTEADIALEISKAYARDIAILRCRYGRIITISYSSGAYRVRDVTGETIFSHQDPNEIGKFLSQAAN
jgi:hypothetical protein